MASATAALKRGRQLPLFDGILPIDRARVPTDVIAGITLAALAIPEVMGYAEIAGMPVYTGLYTILLPIFAFAIFGSSRHLVVGADSATAAILAGGLAALATAGSTEYVELASLAALMCGVFLLLARILRLGFLANFLSRSVLIGFLTGVGIQVAMGQIGGMFGVPEGTGGTVEKFIGTLQNIPGNVNYPTLAISILTIAIIVGFQRFNKAIPGALIAVLLSIFLSYALDLQAEGVAVVGTVPSGLPSLSLPTEVMTSEYIAALMPTVISMVILILAQSAATSRAYAMRYNDRFDENVDLVGLSTANFAAGITGTFVVNGSPTKTEMVDSAGGRSQISQVTAGIVVAIVLVFLTVPLSYMPEAVLSAVVFLIGLRLIDYRGMRDIWRHRRGEFFVALVTATIVVIVGVEQGIILAIALSIIEHIYHSYKPSDTIVVMGDDQRLQAVDRSTAAQIAPGVMVYRFGASLYYANTSRFTEEIVDLVEKADPPLQWFALAASAIGDIDYSGSDTIRQVHEELDQLGVKFAIVEVSPRIRSQLDDYGLTEKIGADRIYDTMPNVTTAFPTSTPDTPDTPDASVTPDAPDASVTPDAPDASVTPDAPSPPAPPGT
jgi:high affinity sulfate transporter 1